MARNKGKRPGGASGSTSRSQGQAEDGRTQTGTPTSNSDQASTKALAPEAGGRETGVKAPVSASSAIAAKIDKAPSTTGTTPNQADKKAAPAQSAAQRSSAASSASSKPAAAKVQADGSTKTIASGTTGGGTPVSSMASSNGGGFWPGLVGGVIGGATTALAASLFWAGGNDGSTMADLESRLVLAEQQVGEVTALSERVSAVEAAPEGATGGDGELAQRLGDLETKFAGLGEVTPAGGDDEALGTQLTALEQRIEELAGEVQSASEARQSSTQTLTGLQDALPTLEAALADTGKTIEEAGEQRAVLDQSIDRLSTTTEELNGNVETLASRVDEAESKLEHLGGEYQRGAAMIVAIGDVDRAISRSEPFSSSLESLKSLVKDDAVLGETLTRLEPVATDGVPTLDELSGEFGAIASRVLLAEEGDQSLTDKVSDNLFGIVNMRPAGAEVEGSDSRAILSRAQLKLSSDDLEGAIAELSGLEGAAAEQAGPWIERASARLAAEAAVVDLRSHAQSLVAKGS